MKFILCFLQNHFSIYMTNVRIQFYSPHRPRIQLHNEGHSLSTALAPHRLMLLPSATKLRRLCFYRCVSVHTGGVCLSACWDTTPPGADTPGSRHPPGADTPQSRHPPTRSRHPRADTPPPERWPLLRTVHILLECVLVQNCIQKVAL